MKTLLILAFSILACQARWIFFCEGYNPLEFFNLTQQDQDTVSQCFESVFLPTLQALINLQNSSNNTASKPTTFSNDENLLKCPQALNILADLWTQISQETDVGKNLLAYPGIIQKLGLLAIHHWEIKDPYPFVSKQQACRVLFNGIFNELLGRKKPEPTQPRRQQSFLSKEPVPFAPEKFFPIFFTKMLYYFFGLSNQTIIDNMSNCAINVTNLINQDTPRTMKMLDMMNTLQQCELAKEEFTQFIQQKYHDSVARGTLLDNIALMVIDGMTNFIPITNAIKDFWPQMEQGEYNRAVLYLKHILHPIQTRVSPYFFTSVRDQFAK